MPLPEEVVTAVSATNFKSLGEAPAFYSNLAMGNAVTYQQAMNNVTLAAIGKITKYLTESDAEESMAVLKMMSGNEPASQISAIMGAIAAAQQQSKTAGNTPPVTP